MIAQNAPKPARMLKHLPLWQPDAVCLHNVWIHCMCVYSLILSLFETKNQMTSVFNAMRLVVAFLLSSSPPLYGHRNWKKYDSHLDARSNFHLKFSFLGDHNNHSIFSVNVNHHHAKYLYFVFNDDDDVNRLRVWSKYSNNMYWSPNKT